MTLPAISVVIPTFGRPYSIRQCVQSFLDAKYPRDRFELLVVDDGSPQPVEDCVRDMRQAGLAVRCFRQQQAGPARARNLGLQHASGELIAFTDDDCQPCAEWLPSLAAAWNGDPESAIAGPLQNALRSNLGSEASQMLIDYCIRYFDPAATSRGFFTSNNMAFPAERLRSIGGFHTGFSLAAAEDRELCSRWFDRGYRFRFVPDAVVHHWHDLSLQRFIRQQFRYGRGAWFYHEARSVQANECLKLEPVAFYSGMLASAFDGRPWDRAIPICALLALSQALTAGGFFYQRYRSADAALHPDLC